MTSDFDRWLTTEPPWRTGDDDDRMPNDMTYGPDEMPDDDDQPDPCFDCDWVGLHAPGCSQEVPPDRE